MGELSGKGEGAGRGERSWLGRVRDGVGKWKGRERDGRKKKKGMEGRMKVEGKERKAETHKKEWGWGVVERKGEGKGGKEGT